MAGPVKKIGNGLLKVVVWENEAQGKDGKKWTNTSFNIENRYRTQDGEWKDAKSFKVSDIPKLVVYLEELYKEEVMKQKEEKAEQSAASSSSTGTNLLNSDDIQLDSLEQEVYDKIKALPKDKVTKDNFVATFSEMAQQSKDRAVEVYEKCWVK